MKQRWIVQNFDKLEALYTDICELPSGVAYDILTERRSIVPEVDVLVAGFVCKSVSSENNKRPDHKHCIREATGATGTTFSGLIGYVQLRLQLSIKPISHES